MIVVAIIFLSLGGSILCTGLCVVACIGFRELLLAMNIASSNWKKPAGAESLGYLCTVALYFATYAYCETRDIRIIQFFHKPLLMMGIIMIPFFVLAIYFVLVFPKFEAEKLMATYFSYLYVPVLICYLYIIRENIQGGMFLVWLVIIAASGTDIFAYFTGSFFGKHKLAPVLSPKKSIEGAVGGVVGAALLALIYGIVIQKMGIEIGTGRGILHLPEDSRIWICFGIIAIFASIISQFGDLLASGIKRNYNIKDYGNLIPGHGGILDRFDSIIFVAPIVYMLSVVLF